MPRLMSVAMTTDAVIERRKTVTRRKGWWVDKNGRRLLHPGDRITLCRKVQGRKPGEPLERLAEVEVVSVERQRLGRLIEEDPWSDDPNFDPSYARNEVTREGFPHLSPEDFVERFFVKAQSIYPAHFVTRIEWRYLDAPAAGGGTR